MLEKFSDIPNPKQPRAILVGSLRALGPLGLFTVRKKNSDIFNPPPLIVKNNYYERCP